MHLFRPIINETRKEIKPLTTQIYKVKIIVMLPDL
jgi:hypothetical protein